MTTSFPTGATRVVPYLRFHAVLNKDGMFFLNVSQIVSLFDHKDEDGKNWTKIHMTDGKARMLPGKAADFVKTLREGIEQSPPPPPPPPPYTFYFNK